MTEQIPTTPHLDEAIHMHAPELVAASVEFSESEAMYVDGLERFAKDIPEVAAKSEALAAAGTELINDFGIKPEFFEESGRTLLFTSVANRLANLDNKQMSRTEIVTEREFIADTAFLLASDYMVGFDDFKASLEVENNPSNLSDEGIKAIYDKYTDREMSKRLQAEINEAGLIDDVKAKLNVTAENEDAYELRVMSMSETEDYVFNFKRPEFPSDDELAAMTREEQLEAMNAWQQDQDAYKAWEAGLTDRRTAFTQALGKEKFSAPAWVTHVGDKQFLCVTADLAERVLEGGGVTDEGYTADDRIRDIAYIGHEYTHTQGGLMPDNKIDFGITLEERRAELYSGDKHGYGDVKNFLIDVDLITGTNPVDFLKESEHKGGDQQEVFTKIANSYGLDSLIEMAAVMPQAYNQEQSNAVRRSIQTYLGGYDGVLTRFAHRQAENDPSTNVMLEKRIEERADRLHEMLQDGVLGFDGYLSYRRGAHGLDFVTTMLENVAKKKGYIE
ncbi:hypothetical protein KA047_01095 [Candidatus Saccharibacteria bacterium]|nr:hypothetical protein [Candidatus Saccharibacteria bacterium]